MTRFGYDSAARVTAVARYTTLGAASGDAQATGFAYPSATTTTVTDPRGHESTFTLDSSGRVTKAVDPLGRERSTTWTTNSDIATATDAMGTGDDPGNVTTYTYDEMDRATGAQIPTGAAATVEYTGSATCASSDTSKPYLAKCATDPQGNQTSLAYDAAGNTLSQRDTTDAPTGGAQSSATYQSAGTSWCPSTAPARA